MRIVFFGTPPFAVPTLRRLAADPAVEIPLVVTQPDRPAGRRREPKRSAVGFAADALDLPTYQPPSLRDAASRAPLAASDADLFVVAAYGLIFGPKTLALPRHGCVNVHASLLPRYRGASPIAAALLAGDRETGVTLIRMETGLDTGPTYAAAREAIAPDDTTESLTPRLALLGAGLVGDLLPALATATASPTPQSGEHASLTRPLTKADGWLDWRLPAPTLERHVRAMWSWPRAWTTVAGTTVQVHRATVVSTAAVPPGHVAAVAPALSVACGVGSLRLDLVQPAGGRPTPGDVFAAGRRLAVGDVLGRDDAPVAPPPLILPP